MIEKENLLILSLLCSTTMKIEPLIITNNIFTIRNTAKSKKKTLNRDTYKLSDGN